MSGISTLSVVWWYDQVISGLYFYVCYNCIYSTPCCSLRSSYRRTWCRILLIMPLLEAFSKVLCFELNNCNLTCSVMMVLSSPSSLLASTWVLLREERYLENFSFLWSIFLLALTHISIILFYPSFSRQRKNFASVFCTFGSCVWMLWFDANGMPTLLAKSRIVTYIFMRPPKRAVIGCAVKEYGLDW